jgi:hypothetical protein
LRFLAQLLAMMAVALAVGFGLSWFALNDRSLFGAIEVGPWSAWRESGAPSPDPYTRAYIARSGALQLGTGEGVRFVATTDSDGRQLDLECNYRVDGTTPVATFWTLVPVNADWTIVTRPEAPAAFHSRRIVRAGDGSMQLHVSKTLRPGNWLEVVGEGPFSLVLTLYDASTFAGVGSAAAEMPAIIREACP